MCLEIIPSRRKQFIKKRNRPRRAARMIPHAGRDSEEIGARADERRRIIGRDAADGADRHDRGFLPRSQDVRRDARFCLFGGGRVKSAEDDMIGALLSGEHRAVARIIGARADDGIRAEQRARLTHRHIVCAEVNAISTDIARDISAIIDDEGDIMRLHERHQTARPLFDEVVIFAAAVIFFEAQLQGDDVSLILRQRSCEDIGEVV